MSIPRYVDYPRCEQVIPLMPGGHDIIPMTTNDKIIPLTVGRCDYLIPLTIGRHVINEHELDELIKKFAN